MARDSASQLRDLQRVTDAALSSLPLNQLLDTLLERVRQILGVDTVAILLLEEDGRTLAARAAKGLEEEVERGVRIPVGGGFAGRVAAERGPVQITDVDHADILNPLLREKGLQSLLGVPLLTEERLIGVLHVGALTTRAFSSDEVDLLQRAADRAALAIGARLYERQRGLAEEMQRSLFPRPLPEFPGVSLAARYWPAASAPLGGDWYDAFLLPTGSLGLVMGDVVGRGFRAAALMAQLRSALRAYAFDGTEPWELMTKLNVLLRRIDPGGSATLLYLVFDSEAEEVHMASAGHLPPLLRRGSEATFVELPRAVPLGVIANPVYDDLVLEAHPPMELVLYTDGLMERAGEALEEGFERLRVAGSPDGSDPEELADRLVGALLPEGAANDDAAVLVMAIHPLGEELEVTMAAEPESAPLLRRILRRWLREHGASPDEVEELTLACGEACANAIEHAYPPEARSFLVGAHVENGDIVMRVQDWGQWRPPRGAHRGKGMTLMEGLTDSVAIEGGEEGTTVTLRRRPQEATAA
ncbi:MAG TPA: SpoIIE family protein phosphatase [Thermoleophilaceae bacterium]|nr:SpoIIE family protein phosphatase [Thermoleophilaceae bacterium]